MVRGAFLKLHSDTYFIPPKVPILNAQLSTFGRVWAFKSGTFGGMKYRIPLPKFPKNYGIGFRIERFAPFSEIWAVSISFPF